MINGNVQIVSSTNETPPNIAGWLWLPVIGMIFAPLGTLAIGEVIDIAICKLREHGRLSKFPHAESLEIFAYTMVVLWIIVSVVAVVFFFQRRRFVPRMMICIYFFHIFFGLILLTAITWVFNFTLTSELVSEFALLMTWPMLWISYFLWSKRVKATFVVDKKRSSNNS